MLALIDFSKTASEENLHFGTLLNIRSDSDPTTSLSKALWLMWSKACDVLTNDAYIQELGYDEIEWRCPCARDATYDINNLFT